MNNRQSVLSISIVDALCNQSADLFFDSNIQTRILFRPKKNSMLKKKSTANTCYHCHSVKQILVSWGCKLRLSPFKRYYYLLHSKKDSIE